MARSQPELAEEFQASIEHPPVKPLTYAQIAAADRRSTTSAKANKVKDVNRTSQASPVSEKTFVQGITVRSDGSKARDTKYKAGREGFLQQLLDSGLFLAYRPDEERKSLGSQLESKEGMLTPYHPNGESSGRIEVPLRDHQYSGRPGSPRNDPGFVRYTNNLDPYDRSYTRFDRLKGTDGILKVAGTAVYDARTMPYIAANKLHRLRQDPQMTYSTIMNSPEVEKKRRVAYDVVQSYDDRKSNWLGKEMPNARDEFPAPFQSVNGQDGKPLEGEARKALTIVGPVPDRESRDESFLKWATRAVAIAAAKEQNEENRKEGRPQQPVIFGIAIMDGDELMYDYGNGKIGPYDGFSDAKSHHGSSKAKQSYTKSSSAWSSISPASQTDVLSDGYTIVSDWNSRR